MRFLVTELERRRRHVATAGAARIEPADAASPFPTIVVPLDNYEGMVSAWEDSTAQAMRDTVVRLTGRQQEACRGRLHRLGLYAVPPDGCAQARRGEIQS